MKKLINNGSDVVDEMMEGIVLMNPLLCFIKEAHVILRRDCSPHGNGKVSLISGGGSGHEPSHAGFVGQGMLDAAVLGNVFSSPTPSQVLCAIKAVTGPKGCLLIVKNYTGDRLNFGMAAEMAREQGLKVKMVIVGDDVALLDDVNKENAGRRGLAGTLFVHKIAGALAESGKDLDEIHKIAQEASDNLFTIGIGLSSCIIPAVGKASFSLEEDEVEIGLGIHGEPGRYKSKLKSANEHADEMVDFLIKHASQKMKDMKSVALLVNNLGGTTLMEMAIFTRRVVMQLESKGIEVIRIFSGPLMTSLEMQGVSLSFLLPFSLEVKSWLDYSTNALAWPNSTIGTVKSLPSPSSKESQFNQISSEDVNTLSQIKKLASEGSKSEFDVQGWTERVIKRMNEVTGELTRLDGLVGDGDLGINLEKAGKIVLSHLDSFPKDSKSFVTALALILGDELGGTTGVLYSIFLLRMSNKLKENGGKTNLDWADSLLEGTNGIESLGGAQVGDRTMIDALRPSSDRFFEEIKHGRSIKDGLMEASKAAAEGAKSTVNMVAKKGRSSYIGDRAKGNPDPGAQAVAYLFQFASEEFRG